MSQDFEAMHAEFERERERIGYETDMIASYRENDMAVYARKCPNCGRYAHVEAGNPTEHYWVVTDCTQCGRWEVRGGPMEWRSLPAHHGRTITVRKL